MRAPWLTIGIASAFAYAVACGPTSVQRTCNDNSDCLTFPTETGFAACTEITAEGGECAPVQCLANEHCDIGNYCNDNFNCVPGCSTDLDCRAGESCDLDTRACFEYGCRSSRLDCNVLEECNVSSGQCQLPSTQHCKECDVGIFGGITCPGNGECFAFDQAQQDLYCLFPCTTQEQCPAGFTCSDPTGGNGTKYCSGACAQLDDDGQLPW